jgi:hypothetical protein
MDEKNTSILFTIDKNYQLEPALTAVKSLARKTHAKITYVQTDDSLAVEGQSGVFEVMRIASTLWKGLAKVAEEKGVKMVLISAPYQKGGLLGGGMSAVVKSFDKCRIVYLNQNQNWVEPRNMLLPIDGNSETRQKLFATSDWSKSYFSLVTVLGVSNPKDKEDQKYSHMYALQAKIYMEERKINVKLEEVQNKNCAEAVLAKSNDLPNCWIAAVSNSDGAFKTSAFQAVCEQAKVPILISPYQEVVGTGSVGY